MKPLLLSLFVRFARDRQGNVLMLTGLAFLFMIAIGGAGIDFGRQQLLRMKMQQATDAAAMAAAIMPASATNQQRTDMALRYYNLNYPAFFLGSDRPTPQITIDDNITVQADKTIATNFIRTGVSNVTSLDARGRTVVQRARNGLGNYDVFLLMDNSGSMSNTDIAASNVAQPTNVAQTRSVADATCLAFNAPIAAYRCPNFSYPIGSYQNVNQCLAGYPGYLCSIDPVKDPGNFGLQGPTRLNALRYAALQLVDTLMTNAADNRVGVVTWAREVFNTVALTSDASAVRAAINGMYAFDATNSTQALLAAEPNIDQAIATDTNRNRVRAVVLLTDGINTYSGGKPIYSVAPDNSTVMGDSNGCTGNPQNGVCDAANTASLAVCSRLKDKRVQIYTIAFGPEVSATTANGQKAQAFLRSCASADTASTKHFFPAADAAELNGIFTTITTQIQNLRIAE